MGGATSSDNGPEAPERGYRVLNVQPNSPAAEGGLKPFFDFVVVSNGVALKAEDTTFVDQIKDHENKELPVTVYSAQTKTDRGVVLRPRQGWGGVGLLGCMIRFDSIANVDEFVWHVTDVYPNSPASVAGLEPECDYIVGTSTLLFKSDEDLHSAVAASMGRKCHLLVYSTRHDSLREVTIVPNINWGGIGSLGCELGNGLLHRIPTRTIPGSRKVAPAPQAPVPPPAAVAASAAPPPPGAGVGTAEEPAEPSVAPVPAPAPAPAAAKASEDLNKPQATEPLPGKPVAEKKEAAPAPFMIPANVRLPVDDILGKKAAAAAAAAAAKLDVTLLCCDADLKKKPEGEQAATLRGVLAAYGLGATTDANVKAVAKRIAAGAAALVTLQKGEEAKEVVLAAFKLHIIVEKESDPDSWLLSPGSFVKDPATNADKFELSDMYVRSVITRPPGAAEVVRGVGLELFPGVDIAEVDLSQYFTFSEFEIDVARADVKPNGLPEVRLQYYSKATLKASEMHEVPFAANGMCVFSTEDDSRTYAWAWLSRQWMQHTGSCAIAVHTTGGQHNFEADVHFTETTREQRESGAITLSRDSFAGEYAVILKSVTRALDRLVVAEDVDVLPKRATLTFNGTPLALAGRPAVVNLEYNPEKKVFHAKDSRVMLAVVDDDDKKSIKLELVSDPLFDFLKA